jgi:hypothetical protein
MQSFRERGVYGLPSLFYFLEARETMGKAPYYAES